MGALPKPAPFSSCCRWRGRGQGLTPRQHCGAVGYGRAGTNGGYPATGVRSPGRHDPTSEGATMHADPETRELEQPWRDRGLPTDERLRLLVDAMTAQDQIGNQADAAWARQRMCPSRRL